MRIFAIVAAAAALLLTTACGLTDAERCADAKNPTECMQVSDAGGDVSDYLTYGMAGYMLGSTMNGGQRQTVIMADPSYHGPRRPVASYEASRERLHRQTVTTTTTRRSPSGSLVTTTRSSSWSSRPSYRSSFSSPSYRSSFSSSSSFRSRR